MNDRGLLRTDEIQYAVLRVYALTMARWLSWLERRPVTAEVVGSSPIRVAQLFKNLHNIK